MMRSAIAMLCLLAGGTLSMSGQPKKEIECSSTVALAIAANVPVSQMDDRYRQTPFFIHPFVIVGTGFVISNDGYIVTALHVIAGLEQASSEIKQRYNEATPDFHILTAGPRADQGRVLMRSNFSVMPFDVVERDSTNDLALLKFHVPEILAAQLNSLYKNNLLTPATLATSNAEPGSSVTTCGFPFAIPEPTITWGRVASYALYARDFSGQPTTPTAPPFTDFQLVDLRISGGNSGGAVISEESRAVVGMVDIYRNEIVNGVAFNGIGAMIPVAAIRQLAIKNKVHLQ